MTKRLKEIEDKLNTKGHETLLWCSDTDARWLIARVKRLEEVLRQYAAYDVEGSTLRLLGRPAKEVLEEE
jgi:hypothetical protein